MQVLPPSADALLLPDLRLELGVADGETKALLESVRSGAARFHDDDARLTLARAELRYGDRDRAAEWLNELVGRDP